MHSEPSRQTCRRVPLPLGMADDDNAMIRIEAQEMLSHVNQAGARTQTPAVTATPAPAPQAGASAAAQSILRVSNSADPSSCATAKQPFTLGRDLIFGITPEIRHVRNYGSAYLGITRDTVVEADDGKPMTAVDLFVGLSDMTEAGLSNSGVPVLDDFASYYSNPDSHYSTHRESRIAETANRHNDAVERELESLRRMCKGALDSVLSNGGTIHFLLDSQDMEVVLDKSKHRVTASELRWLYRNREAVEQQPGKVVFYSGGNVVDAPWVARPDLWATYTPKSSK